MCKAESNGKPSEQGFYPVTQKFKIYVVESLQINFLYKNAPADVCNLLNTLDDLFHKEDMELLGAGAAFQSTPWPCPQTHKGAPEI